MKTLGLLLLFPLLSWAYNLSPEHAIIYQEPSPKNEKGQAGSYFGYNVILYHSEVTNKSWIIIGAPKANYTLQPEHGNTIPAELGAAYLCSIPDLKCELISIRSPDDEMGSIEQIGLRMVIKKKHGWFGAAMSLDESSGSIVICAPRTIVRIHNSSAARYINTMHGACYEGDLLSGSLDVNDKNFTTFDFSSPLWFNPMNGFAVHYPSSKAKTNYTIRPIVGSVNHELYGTVHVTGQKKPVELPISDDLTRFGYALSSGYYFHEEQFMIAAAAPGWQYVGQVAIIDPRSDPVSIITTIDGKEMGEYFGASLATGDINNDGLDDLIVGAPHWKNDNGRVYIFLGNRAGFFDANLFAEGLVDDGLFGYAVTSGDIDGDGFYDIIISAPWEESGVIYVYNGDSKLTIDKVQEVTLMEPSQRIVGSSIRSDLLRFGFSLSKPVDVDGNGFLDVGVGAYASGHAVVLFSRPVKRTEMVISLSPPTLSRKATSFVMKMCVKHFENNKLSIGDFILTDIFDENHKRIWDTTHPHSYHDSTPETETCPAAENLNLLKDIQNYVDPINIVITHEFKTEPDKYWRPGYTVPCTLCPIEYKGVPSKTFRTHLVFEPFCGVNGICNAFISANLEFQEIRNSTWIIGSSDVRLILSIGNHGDPAFLTNVTFDIPKGISLRNILPSCQEEINEDELLKISCDVDNPLGTDVEKKIIIDLDMSRISNASTDGTKLIFPVRINTQSKNHGVNNISIHLHPKANVSVTLSGKAYEDSYYFNYGEKPSNVSLQHVYQLSCSGTTRIPPTDLIVRVPYKFNDVEFLTILRKPRIDISGRLHDCSVNEISVPEPRIYAKKVLIDKSIGDFYHLDAIASNSLNRRTRSETNHAKTDTNFVESRGYKIPPSEFNEFSSFGNADMIYLDCSAHNVTCGLIVCDIPSLKTCHDVAKLQLDLVINNGKLTDNQNYTKERVIQFTTDARVTFQNPTMNVTVPGIGIFVPVTTKFHRVPYIKNEISVGVILGSFLVGILLLCGLTFALWKIGFFKREKERSENVKTTEPIEAIPLESENVFI